MGGKTKPMLIVSQQYHSYHLFVAEYDPETFLAKAQAFIAELEAAKSLPGEPVTIEYGDVCEKWWKDGKVQSNVNARSGDIYFVVRPSVQSLMYDINEYILMDYRATHARGFLTKQQTQRVAQTHNFSIIKEIVYRHFNRI